MPLPALQRAQTSKLHGFLFIKLLKPKPRRRHRVAHRAAHRWEPCEIGGVVEIARSENVRDNDVVEKAGMASPPLAAVASRRSRFLLRARVSIPHVALGDMPVWVCGVFRGRCAAGCGWRFCGTKMMFRGVKNSPNVSMKRRFTEWNFTQFAMNFAFHREFKVYQNSP